MTQTADLFHNNVLKELETRWKELRALRDASLQPVTPEVLSKLRVDLNSLHDDVWRVLENARTLGRRHRLQIARARARGAERLRCCTCEEV